MTTQPRFIQIHTLHTYPAALINRDDAGLAKRLPFGNAVRTRISSQCLKRHWRKTDDPFSLSMLHVPMAVRSRLFFEKIAEILVSASVSDQIANAIAFGLREAMTKKDLGKLIKEAKKPPKKNKKAQINEEDFEEPTEETSTERKQAFLLGYPEYEYLKKVCLEVSQLPDICEKNARLYLFEKIKAEQENLKQIALGCGLESALFGRMVTSDVLAGREAAIYVGHAFTVHAAQVESDYFTVVDDLTGDSGELGSAGIFDTELTSGLYYGYVVVDVRQLVENLEGIEAKDCFADTTPAEKRKLAGTVVEHLLHLIATVSPGAKRGSTAPFDWAKFMLVEAGDWQPRSLAGAFHNALPLSLPLSARDGRSIRERAVACLSDEIAKMDEAYGATLTRRVMALDPVEIPQGQRLNLNALATWAAEAITKGVC
ncbi:type I-E CRISPR-associated protein Cas7/Cse4/CasC [Thiocystis violascens]|uniref:CRISPR-associated protein Cas7/Cse4/CasC, subtype I-E/ECOLI n=1 Tax=Thiocystis violascens (strain ATCC 17096 / DSM 198 / 6111) TaxID=765911 RepID=I3Y7Y9_THIV6|nr:type I-E CRISPR-associated protein Cas7/Cse4/CasC [Thiocystis violascens]AFL73107.1 CRISPR-associated protein Cas7/Cse4/CasC, subtype I-E/ECOLI [Thiocystis violascens DSM 198]